MTSGINWDRRGPLRITLDPPSSEEFERRIIRDAADRDVAVPKIHIDEPADRSFIAEIPFSARCDGLVSSQDRWKQSFRLCCPGRDGR